MDYETVKFEVRPDGIATMTLNRPEKLNSFTTRMCEEWRDVAKRCAYDDSIRILVITGSGRAFSSGVDVSLLNSDKGSSGFRFYYRENHLGLDAFEALEKPVIAAINGICYGGGVELAISCDILIASDDAEFCLVENQLGAIPASGACNRLLYYVGVAKTKELIITAAPIGAQEALRIGLVNHVVDQGELLAKAYEYAEKLLPNSPLAMGMGKHIVQLCMNTDMHTGRYIERLGQSVLASTRDFEEGVRAFAEKRSPKFEGR